MTPEQLEQLRAASGRACAMLKTLANPDRLLLVCQMVQSEKSVGELEALTGIHQPTLSQQLAVLRNEGLVATRRDGKFIRYRLASEPAQRLLGLLYQLYCPPGLEG